jgi:predicted GNAT family acetyltransferase
MERHEDTMKQQHQPPGPGELVHDEARSRYEMRIDGRVAATAQYTHEGDAVCFTHTEVDPAFDGQGIGSRLAAFALDDLKRRGMKARPQCKFIAAYMERHEKEYGELLQR